MNYSTDEIREYVNYSREKLTKRLVIYTVLLLFGTAGLIFSKDTTLMFISVVLLLSSIILTIKATKKYPPQVLWARELRGINVKEHEYLQGYQRGGFGMRSLKYGNRFRTTRSHLDPLPSKLKAIVYLRLDDGSIKEIGELSKAHTDIYRDKDELVRYEGTRYPVIIGRRVERQPCPLCGTVNGAERDACFCGLSIIKDDINEQK